MKCKLLDGKYYRTEDGRQVVYEAGARLELADWEYEAFSNKFQLIEVAEAEVPTVNTPAPKGDKDPVDGDQGGDDTPPGGVGDGGQVEEGHGKGGENDPDTGAGGHDQGENDNLPDGGQTESVNQEPDQDINQDTDQDTSQEPDQDINQEANQDTGQEPEQGPTQGIDQDINQDTDQDSAEPCPGLKHIGGGVFELPNGTRVRGRENAEAALVELTKQKE